MNLRQDVEEKQEKVANPSGYLKAAVAREGSAPAMSTYPTYRQAETPPANVMHSSMHVAQPTFFLPTSITKACLKNTCPNMWMPYDVVHLGRKKHGPEQHATNGCDQGLNQRVTVNLVESDGPVLEPKHGQVGSIGICV